MKLVKRQLWLRPWLQWAALCCLVLSGNLTVSALDLRGTTQSGMHFFGRALSINGGVLQLLPALHGGSVQIGLPVSKIRECVLVRELELPDAVAFRDFLRELEPFADLLPTLGAADRKWILKGLENLADAGDAAAVYRWSDRLLALPISPDEAGDLGLLRARCLFAMGLREQAATEAAALVAQYDPLCIPTDLCQLMAALAQASGDYQAAHEWSALPGLRIPAEPITLTSRP